MYRIATVYTFTDTTAPGQFHTIEIKVNAMPKPVSHPLYAPHPQTSHILFQSISHALAP